jgi:L-asparaginase
VRTVRLATTGGTIASRASAQGRVASAGGLELLRQTGVPGGIAVSVHDVAVRGSFAWSLQELRAVVEEICSDLAEEVDGVVVTHGTDTMEETVFLASLLIDDDRPVVFTGAQRPFDDQAPDGPANLADALTVAASQQARGRGPLLCFDGHVFAARGVTKVDTLGAHAFGAPGRGAVLRVVGGTVVPLVPSRRPYLLGHKLPELPRVDVVSLYVGADDGLLRAAIAAGARGIVLGAFGMGNANPQVIQAVAELTAAGVPVLVCSRVPSGPVMPLYGGGGGADLQRAGAAFGADLSPWQGRLLLSAALACSPDDPLRVVAGYLAH